jgi:cytosine/creatinine deaminase
VDTTPDHLRGVEAMLEVKRRVAPYLDLQLVAFPQDGSTARRTGGTT